MGGSSLPRPGVEQRPPPCRVVEERAREARLLLPARGPAAASSTSEDSTSEAEVPANPSRPPIPMWSLPSLSK